MSEESEFKKMNFRRERCRRISPHLFIIQNFEIFEEKKLKGKKNKKNGGITLTLGTALRAWLLFFFLLFFHLNMSSPIAQTCGQMMENGLLRCCNVYRSYVYLGVPSQSRPHIEKSTHHKPLRRQHISPRRFGSNSRC